MSKVAMELEKVTKKIGQKEIIKDLSFQIHEGEVFGLIGPNGAGKTTTIRMMVGLLGITKGDIRILGHSIQKDFKQAIQKVGAIVENPEMYPFMTGWQNLKHYARMIPGISEERIDEVVSFVGLEKPIHDKVKTYSLGMRQRLGIAQALLHRPSILILDEPTNGLDPAGIREIRNYIRKLATEENVSVIISSHLLSEIERICDRIGIIKNGELVAIQKVQEGIDEVNLRQVQVEVTPLQRAEELLTELQIDSVLTGNRITFHTERKKIPEIVKALVINDLSVFSVQVTHPTLEDKFFDLIGENIIE